MKTPREILIARHRPAEPKLDAVRQKVLAALPPRSSLEQNGRLDAAPRFSPLGRLRLQRSGWWGLRVLGQLAAAAPSALRKAWLELIWPSRHAWAVLTAIWLAVLGANLQMKATSQAAPTVQLPPRILAQALEERWRVLAELLPPSGPRPAAGAGLKVGPRSERPSLLKTC